MSVGPDMIFTSLLYTLTLRTLVEMACLQDSLLIPLPMTLHSGELELGYFLSPSTTPHIAVSGTVGSLMTCCLFLKTTVEIQIYYYRPSSIRSKFYYA